MFRFEHPEFFWLWAGFILLVALIPLVRKYRKDAWSKWGSELSNTRVVSQLRRPRWTWMFWSGLALICLAASNPQWGFKKVAVETRSTDLYILFDISSSMLANDVAPNRLERARRFALDFIENHRRDRIGLIYFAGNAYLQSPLTTDWHAVRLFLSSAHPDQAGTQGTAIGDAIRLVMSTQAKAANPGQGACILITDGEDHDSDAIDAAAEAADAGWPVYAIGVGTTQGSYIPLHLHGNKEVKRDPQGQPVTSALNEKLIRDLADAGRADAYFLSQENEVFPTLEKSIGQLERTQKEKRSFSEHRSYFQWFLLPGIILLCLPVFLEPKRQIL